MRLHEPLLEQNMIRLDYKDSMRWQEQNMIRLDYKDSMRWQEQNMIRLDYKTAWNHY